MEALAKLIPILLTVSLAMLVLAVGMNSGKGELQYVFRRPPLLAKGVLAVIVIPPVAAGLLIAALPLHPVVEAGIMLMAISPVPPLVPGKELSIGGRKEYAYGLYCAMALLTIVSVPLVLALTSRVFGRHDGVPVADIARTVGLGVVLPLAVGLVIHRLWPAFAGRAWSLVNKTGLLLVVLAFLPIIIKVWPALMGLVGDGTLAIMAVVTLIAIAGGHLLGGPNLEDRATLAMASSVRHPGIAMSLAASEFADQRISAAVLLFMLVGLVVAVPYTVWIKRRLRTAPPVAA
ncbi:MAG: hypothetical protein KA105_09795 [Caulobacter sp.]|jgi:BASS family bile acid:Na+ symporter|nr:hypothetical protein [Caulobacter sp.]